MRLPLIRISLYRKTFLTSAYRTMSTVPDFVATAQKADPSLAGSSEKDQKAISKLVSETEGMAKDLSALNDKLTPLTYLYANIPSTADVSLYCHIHPSLITAPESQNSSHPALLRYFLHIQSLSAVRSAQTSLPNSFPPLDVDVSTLPIPERKVVIPPKKEKKPAASAIAVDAAATASNIANGTVAAASTVASDAAATISSAAGSVAAAISSAAGDIKEAIVGSTSSPSEAADSKKDGKKKEKKEKAPKAAAPAKVEPAGPLPSMIDMRVGKILDVKKHPDAESLYVESIDIGEETGPRTVCSGLVKYMTEAEIQDQTVIIICNLKPVTMRGVKSYAMLLCASSADGKDTGGIEFVLPPPGSKPGDRVYFEGEKYENAVPEAQLNPKKKVFETIQPGFTTLDNLEAAWIDPETKSVHRIRTALGVCKSKTLKGASLS